MRKHSDSKSISLVSLLRVEKPWKVFLDHHLSHYQKKINKHKQKYWQNIFIDKLLWILLIEIFYQYIPIELWWKKKSQILWWRVIYTNKITDGINFVGKIVGKLFTSPWHCSSSVFSRELCNYLLSSCTINYCYLQTKSLTS
jgi:hypothetical protein